MSTIHDSAAIYALGALDGEDLGQFEAHLQTGCEQCAAEVRSYQEVASDLTKILPQRAPSPEVRQRLLDSLPELASGPDRVSEVQTGIGAGSAGGFVTIRAQQGNWTEIAPGIQMKPLYAHAVRNYATALLRIAPGTYYPRHRHLDAEELFVLEGHCQIDGRSLGPGDYHRAAASSLHQETYSPGGCLLLMITSGGGHTFI